MGKSAIDAPRVNAFSLDPDEVVLVTDPKHVLFDKRALLPPDEQLVKSIMAKGVLTPIHVFRDGDKVLVINGRRRVTAARSRRNGILCNGAKPFMSLPARCKASACRC